MIAMVKECTHQHARADIGMYVRMTMQFVACNDNHWYVAIIIGMVCDDWVVCQYDYAIRGMQLKSLVCSYDYWYVSR